MFTAGGGPGEVHSYFSPYESPMDAFVAAQTLLNDFEARLRLTVLTANEPFLFYTGVGKQYYTGNMAWSLKGLIKAIKEVAVTAVEFHVSNGDFESWAQSSLKDPKLALQFKGIKGSNEKGEKLRETILDFTKNRYATLNKQTQDATKLF
jgi:alpha-amylase